MGFSFNNIDLPYIDEIVKVNSNIDDADWKLYCHELLSNFNRQFVAEGSLISQNTSGYSTLRVVSAY